MATAPRRSWLQYLAALAGVGMVLSIFVHLMTFVGFDATSACPMVWLLQLGVFVVLFPAFAVNPRKSKQPQSWMAAFSGGPRWTIPLVSLTAVYALVNFLIITGSGEGHPTKQPDGSYALTIHGHVTRVISEPDFHHYELFHTRAFSGHWMFFYTLAMALLLSAAARRTQTLIDPYRPLSPTLRRSGA